MYKNLLSSSKTINAGVPKGSVLGPLLFLIYVNAVSDKMLSMCRLFADDNSLQYSSNNIAEMECSINQDLNTLDLITCSQNCYRVPVFSSSECYIRVQDGNRFPVIDIERN